VISQQEEDEIRRFYEAIEFEKNREGIEGMAGTSMGAARL